MSIRSELLALQQASPDHILHVSEIVGWARENTGSTLYKSLEWDNEKAAEAHRFWQVRQLIQMHITQADGTPMVVSLSIDRRGAGGYRAISDVIERPDLREIMLADALSELERIQEKYRRVKELESVWLEADRIRAQVPARTRRRSRETATA